MTPLEKVLLGLVQGAASDAPLFVHSAQGTLILNASEGLLAGILAQFVPAPAVATPAAS